MNCNNFGKLTKLSTCAGRILSRLQKTQKFGYGSQASNSCKLVVNGSNVHYEIAGSGRTRLVCFPGTLGFAKGDFAAQLTSLNKEKFTIIAVNPLGHGESKTQDGIDRDYSGNFFDRDATLVSHFMDKLGYEKYSAFGWSQGAISAIHLAAKFPQRVQKLITLGCFAFVDDTIMNNERLANVDTWSPQMKDPFIAYYGLEYTKSSWDGWKNALFRMQRDEGGDLGHLKLLERVKCPTLIVQGSKDPICPQYHAEYLHKMIPNSKLHLFPTGGHNVHLHPRLKDEFNSLIENFLLTP